jgi:hypothetical protein
VCTLAQSQSHRTCGSHCRWGSCSVCVVAVAVWYLSLCVNLVRARANMVCWYPVLVAWKQDKQQAADIPSLPAHLNSLISLASASSTTRLKATIPPNAEMGSARTCPGGRQVNVRHRHSTCNAVTELLQTCCQPSSKSTHCQAVGFQQVVACCNATRVCVLDNDAGGL